MERGAEGYSIIPMQPYEFGFWKVEILIRIPFFCSFFLESFECEQWVS